MQQSFIIVIPFEERSLTKPIKDLLVLPENTIGGYIIRKKNNMRKITIHFPRINYECSLVLASNDLNELSNDISFFNLICSLQKCAIKLSVIPKDSLDIGELQIEVIAYGEDVKFLKSAREKLCNN